jgi:hypothetical protein
VSRQFEHLPFAQLSEMTKEKEEPKMDNITDPILSASKDTPPFSKLGEPLKTRQRRTPVPCRRGACRTKDGKTVCFCPDCNRDKELTSFYYDKDDGHHRSCIACKSLANKKDKDNRAKKGITRETANKTPRTVSRRVKHATKLVRISEEKLFAGADGADLLLSFPKKESIAKLDATIEARIAEISKLRRLRKVIKAL